ncbi:leucine-rich repeat-containing protein 56 [Scleropages formosus]|uniref:Leucine rich repeat containing 56 n=2 Tax=Scleropages formosus TaxID=113540 RepID=A0A8C9UYX1_SCLFO|nr:leucine-rich repeat-containing protein 56 [Scleropages formosus]XP_018620939.2 leucine-rich repeat-containing protein 56 [Scleropages formosus]
MHCSDECVTVGRPDSPCLARVSGLVNPTPVDAEELELLAELHLSPEKLRALTGAEDLNEVTVLELCVDTRQSTLSNLGSYLPKLVQLKMNGSVIASVRDLGTTFSRLQVLWMARCGLADLDGILAFASLKELYVAYNEISDLSHISLLEHLEILDLEGNSVDDLSQVQYLGLCGSLRALTLDGNPMCARPHPDAPQTELYCYRSAVRQLLPRLHYLDDVPAGDTGARCGADSLEDRALIRESIKEAVSGPPEERAASAGFSFRPGSAQRPGTTPRPLSGATSRPGTARSMCSAGSRPGSADSGPKCIDPGASDLTHGTGQVMCGNPGQALRTRHRKMNLLDLRSEDPNPFAHLQHVPERSFDLDEHDGKDPGDVLAELMVWREKHNSRLIAIERDRQAQVMKVSHSDGEDDEDEEEGSRGSTLSSMSDEEEGGCGGAGIDHWSSVESPDSSFQSPGPEFLHEREAASPDILRQPLSPDLPLFPSPPLMPVAPPAGRKVLSEMRRRRFRFKVPEMEVVKDTDESVTTETGGRTGVPVLKARNPKIPPAPGPCSAWPQRPTSSPAAPRSRMNGSAELHPVNSHHPDPDASSHLVPLPPACPRPHTARAAIQRPPRRPVFTPDRGSTHCS